MSYPHVNEDQIFEQVNPYVTNEETSWDLIYVVRSFADENPAVVENSGHVDDCEDWMSEVCLDLWNQVQEEPHESWKDYLEGMFPEDD